MSFEGLPTEHRDTLTSLPNLLAIKEALDKAISVQPGEFALVALDVDGFKIVNDTYGHAAGDIVLQRVADVLAANLREDDQFLPARRSGDEFNIIIGRAKTEEQVQAVCERIRTLMTEAICQPLPYQPDVPLDLGVSIGGRVHQVGENAEDLRDAADLLMIKDKIDRKIDRYNHPETRRAIYEMARLALQYGIAIRDIPTMIGLHRQELY